MLTIRGSSLFTLDVPGVISEKYFSFMGKAFASTQRLESKYQAPVLTIYHTIAREWLLPDDFVDLCSNKSESLAPCLSSKLPSRSENRIAMPLVEESQIN